MTYRDNVVIFKIRDVSYKYKLIGGRFSVTNYCISHGQDPARHLIRDNPYSMQNGALTFSLGRRGSKECAKWFNRLIDKDHNTFGHEAGKLNFIIIGTLELEINNLGEGTTASYTFQDIALAQGRAGSRNNWWFGSPQGEHASASDHTIDCIGVDLTGKRWYFTFKRGGAGSGQGQDVNEVEICNIIPAE